MPGGFMDACSLRQRSRRLQRSNVPIDAVAASASFRFLYFVGSGSWTKPAVYPRVRSGRKQAVDHTTSGGGSSDLCPFIAQ